MSIIETRDQAKEVLSMLEVYACSKRLLDSGVLPKQINGTIDPAKSHVLMRKQIKAYVNRKFPTSELRLVAQGVKIIPTPNQNKMLNFLITGGREASTNREYVRQNPAMATVVDNLTAVLTRMHSRIDVVRSFGDQFSILVRCGADTIQRSRSMYDWLCMTLATLDTFKSRLDEALVVIHDIDAAIAAGKALKERAEAERAQRQVNIVQGIVNELRGIATPTEGPVEVEEAAVPQEDEPVPFIHARDEVGFNHHVAEAPEDVIAGTGEEERTIEQVLTDHITRLGEAITEQAADAPVLERRARIPTVHLTFPNAGVPNVAPVEEPRRHVDPLRQAEMNEILRRLGHNV